MPKTAAYHRPCTECGKPLESTNPKKKTCSDGCRAKRSKRLKKQGQGQAAVMTAAAHGPIPGMDKEAIVEVSKEVMKEELRPVVREAIQEDTLRAVKELVGLAPVVVAALAQDLLGDVALDDDGQPKIDPETGEPLRIISPDRRQKAYTQWLRYTVGHGALVPTEEKQPAGLTVVFPGMPRPDGAAEPVPQPQPGDTVASEEEIVDAEPVIETLICNACGTEKPREEFVGRSDRCQECHESLVQRARALEDTIAEDGTRAG